MKGRFAIMIVLLLRHFAVCSPRDFVQVFICIGTAQPGSLGYKKPFKCYTDKSAKDKKCEDKCANLGA